MGYYVNYNKHGQSIGGNSVVPHNINVSGTKVEFDGAMSKRTFDTVNAENLVSHSAGAVLYATSEDAANKVAALLAQNPNYSRDGA